MKIGSCLEIYSPAECMLLIHGDRADARDLLKLTLADLFIRDVLGLKAEERARIRDTREKSNTLHYVYKGKHFETYNPRAHEKLFTEPFFRTDSEKILLRHLIIDCFEYATERNNFFHLVRKTTGFSKLIKRGLMQYFTGGFKLSVRGQEAGEAIKKELIDLEQTLRSSERKRALALIGNVGANIFLIPAFRLPILDLIEREINWEENRSIRRESLYPGYVD